MPTFDKDGMPKVRNCTCKNKDCRAKWKIDYEDPFCPVCGMVHCPGCLKGYSKGMLHSTTDWLGGAEVYEVTTTCPNPKCGWHIFEYEYC